MSDWLVPTLVMAASCALVLAVTVVSARRRSARGAGRPPAAAPEPPNVLEYMTMMIGVVYAIVLGLAIAGVWEERGAAQGGVQAEAQALYDIRQRADALPQETRTAVREDVDAYVSHVVREDWPRMVKGDDLPQRGHDLLTALRQRVTEQAAAPAAQPHLYQPLLERISYADAARNARAESSGTTLPPVVWFGLIIGALVTVGLVFTMNIGRSARELLVAGLFTVLISFLLFLVWDFDAPFGRAGTDSADAFRLLFPHVT
ncbi:hypothetical protein ACFVIM_24980 [Streptomyces sp. NPDC057638]|uniref:bestrophin-like domain n=1 Tax=Streptomyces sp. NPDC057638 TaxID=3346190 RepID=UPI003699F38C